MSVLVATWSFIVVLKQFQLSSPLQLLDGTSLDFITTNIIYTYYIYYVYEHYDFVIP